MTQHSAPCNSKHSASGSCGHHDAWTWLGDGTLRAEDAEEGLGHIVPLRTFNLIFGVLLCLTVVTVAASRFDFGVLNMFIAVVIASIKASLVLMFFMHLKFEKNLIVLYAIYPIIILFTLIGGSFLDVADREQALPFWQDKEQVVAKPAPGDHH